MSQSLAGASIGHAWALHREGKNDEAAREFERVGGNEVQELDALYGMGLAQRSSGDLAGATRTFQACLDRLTTTGKSINHNRYEILVRMVNQRLEELQVVAR